MHTDNNKQNIFKIGKNYLTIENDKLTYNGSTYLYARLDGVDKYPHSTKLNKSMLFLSLIWVAALIFAIFVFIYPDQLSGGILIKQYIIIPLKINYQNYIILGFIALIVYIIFTYKIKYGKKFYMVLKVNGQPPIEICKTTNKNSIYKASRELEKAFTQYINDKY